VIEVDDLPEVVRPHRSSTAPSDSSSPQSGTRRLDLGRELARAELRLVEQAMAAAEGRKGEAWKLLGLNNRFALRRRVRRLLSAHPDLAAEFPSLDRSFRTPR